ncbi:hypothetical protein M3202_19620 [Alkalihalobacillus oceani]|uniref:Uncharacterized protein n=1 Tax=Halalkalibacter oceani TaxID=1653776 RepID=A0A9X2IQV7_9BACI|nr:hypothetical protein [Halalkalibacter oceani]MCM3716256.1 hypothetical protein [Halalkalibacter oceani]
MNTNKLKSSIKIYKHVTKKSAFDITTSLFHFTQKPNEDVYKGKVIFSVTEMSSSGSDSKYAKAYIDKSKIKPMLHAIINHNFSRVYGDGFKVYGGSKKNGDIIARCCTITFTDRNQFKIQIDEGKGSMSNTGAIKMIKRVKSVTTYMSYEEGLIMAHEVKDFINQAEICAMSKGKPLYTQMFYSTVDLGA